MLNASAVATIAIANRLRRHSKSRHAAKITTSLPRTPAGHRSDPTAKRFQSGLHWVKLVDGLNRLACRR